MAALAATPSVRQRKRVKRIVITRRTTVTLAAAILLLTGAILITMGRPPICTCGYVAFWHGRLDAGNSQHLLDWYSLSHVAHGLLFCAATALLMRRATPDSRLLTAVLVEAGWELVENSPWIIDRYRNGTMALGYTGDSVINSLADITCMTAGFLLARRLPIAASAALLLLLELTALAAIRDNLTLNVIMLVHPIDAIRTWQGF